MFAILAVPPRPYTLVVGGDIMLNGIRAGSNPLAGVAKTFREADFAMANLEIPLTDAQTPTTRKTAAELRARTQFVLKADPRHATDLKKTGFDAVSLGNNHAMDYGDRGLAQERSILAKIGIKATGAGPNGTSAASLAIVTGPDGFRVGLLSALAFMGRGSLLKCGPAGRSHAGVNVLSFNGKVDDAARAKLRRWVGGAVARCDYLVVALHWGIERQTRPTAYQVALGRAVADAGADLVWGSHPHVLQPTETYRGVPILYSTGNLVSPLPGRSALYRLAISRRKSLSLSVLSVRIQGGKATLVPGGARKGAAERIIGEGSRSRAARIRP